MIYSKEHADCVRVASGKSWRGARIWDECHLTNLTLNMLNQRTTVSILTHLVMRNDTIFKGDNLIPTFFRRAFAAKLVCRFPVRRKNSMLYNDNIPSNDPLEKWIYMQVSTPSANINIHDVLDHYAFRQGVWMFIKRFLTAGKVHTWYVIKEPIFGPTLFSNNMDQYCGWVLHM